MADDDEVEVKVFTSQDTEEQDAQDQLTEDKKDVVLEAEMEVTARPEDIGLKPGGAFSKPQPSPSFGGFPMGMQMPMSPTYNPMLFMMQNMMRPQLSPGYMMNPLMMNMGGALSPAYAALMGPGSPIYQAMAQNVMHAASKMEQNVPLASSMRSHMNPLSQINQMRLPYAGCGITSLANGMPDHLNRTRNPKIKKEDHIKKPLNAFMWFMKENRPKILNELGFKEKQSAELNKELGRRWQDLDKNEQAKYFEMAKKDREDHKARFPNWSARENYAIHKKKKKRRDRTEVSEATETKKCRARFGTTRQDLWCKFCKRKKKCEWATSVEGMPNMDLQDRISASGSSGPSPMASSSSMGGPSPLGSSHQDSDTSDMDETDLDAEMDDDQDEEDTTLTHQALQEAIKPEPSAF